MKRTQLIALGTVVLFAALVVIMALRTRQAPVLLADEDHVFVSSETCDSCHSAEGGLPRSLNHPVGKDCLRCHGLP